MFGTSDNNRSQDQGGWREALSTKAGGGKGPTVGTRTGSEAMMRATSVLGNAKSNCHRKTHRVEPDGAGRKFTHLTRGGLRRESVGGVSRGHSSEEGRGNPVGAKGRRARPARSTNRLRWAGRADIRNQPGATTAVTSRLGASGAPGWNPRSEASAEDESAAGRGEGASRCATR